MDKTQAVDSAVRRTPRLLAFAAMAALAAVLLGGTWWVTHPTRLEPVSGVTGMKGAVGQPTLVGLFAYPRNGSVVLRDATPRVAPGSAAANVRVLWCIGPTDGMPIGALPATARASCNETPPLGGQRLTMPMPDTNFGHLVLEIIPLEPGEVTVEGADVAYSAGLQRGKQASGLVVEVNAPA
jgi:hypothetical protein